MTEDKTTYQQEMSNLPVPVATIKQWAERRAAFNEWVNTQLRDGIDYGTVPGVDKKTLFKPGAEKIMQLYGCAIMLDAVRRDQEPSTGYLYIEFVAKAVSIQTGQIIGMGVGAASTYESKYRWRWEWWNDKGQPDMTAGWEKFTKRNNTVSWRRRMENRDLIDQWNTVLKMAKKRALVDLALTISGASEKFTQDVEDQVDTTPAETEKPASAGNGGDKGDKKPAPAPAAKSPRPWAPAETKAQLATILAAKGRDAGEWTAKIGQEDGRRGAMVGALAKIVGGEGLGADQNRHFVMNYLWGTIHSADLTIGQVATTLDWLNAGPDAVAEIAAIVALCQAEAGQEALL